MERTSVSSSNISSVGYDSKTETLEIEFVSGAVYQYFQVSEAVYRELMGAGSHGQYFGKNIRDVYSFSKV